MADVQNVPAPNGEIDYPFFTIVAMIDGEVAKIAVSQELYREEEGAEATGNFIALVQHGSTRAYTIEPAYNDEEETKQTGWKPSIYWAHSTEIFDLIAKELNQYADAANAHLN